MKSLSLVATFAFLLACGVRARAETGAETQKAGADTKFDLSSMSKDQTSGGTVYAGAGGSRSTRAASLPPAAATADKSRAPAEPPKPAEEKKEDHSTRNTVLKVAGGFVAGAIVVAVAGMILIGNMLRPNF